MLIFSDIQGGSWAEVDICKCNHPRASRPSHKEDQKTPDPARCSPQMWQKHPPIKYMSQFGLDLLDWRVNRNFIDHLEMSPGFAAILYWQTNADSTSGVCQAKHYPIVFLELFSNDWCWLWSERWVTLHNSQKYFVGDPKTDDPGKGLVKFFSI